MLILNMSNNLNLLCVLTITYVLDRVSECDQIICHKCNTLKCSNPIIIIKTQTQFLITRDHRTESKDTQI